MADVHSRGRDHRGRQEAREQDGLNLALLGTTHLHMTLQYLQKCFQGWLLQGPDRFLKFPLSSNVTILDTRNPKHESWEDTPHPNTGKKGRCLSRGGFVTIQTFCRTLNRPRHSLYPWILGSLPKLQTILNAEINLKNMNCMALGLKCWQGNMLAIQQTFDAYSLYKQHLPIVHMSFFLKVWL